MVRLGKADLSEFGDAILEDYGVRLTDEEVERGANNLILFFLELKREPGGAQPEFGSKVIQDEFLKTKADREKI